MKKLTIIAISGFVIFSSISSLSALEMKSMKWTKYKTRFQIPKHWKITTSNGKAFIAKGDGVVMKIGPYKSRRATAKSTAKRAYYSYSVVKNKRTIQEKFMTKNKSGLTRYIMFGKGIYAFDKPASRKNKKVTFGIIGLTNPNTVDNLYVRFYWFNEDANIKKNRLSTWKIASSFKAMR